MAWVGVPEPQTPLPAVRLDVAQQIAGWVVLRSWIVSGLWDRRVLLGSDVDVDWNMASEGLELSAAKAPFNLVSVYKVEFEK